MSLKQIAVKPWKRGATGPYGASVILWAVLAVAVWFVSLLAVVIASAAYRAGYLPEVVVDPLSLLFSVVPPVLLAAAVISFAVAGGREIWYWHRKHRK